MAWLEDEQSSKPLGSNPAPSFGRHRRWLEQARAYLRRRLEEAGLYRSESPVRNEIKAHLVSSLYGSLSSLVIGAVATSGVSVLVAKQAGDVWLTICAVCICLLAIARIIASVLYSRRTRPFDPARMAWWEQCFALGAWGYSMLLGFLGALTLLRSEDGSLHLLAVTTAIGYAAGISARNAARPMIALVQLGLALFPIALILAISNTPTLWALAFTIVILGFAMVEISIKTHLVMMGAMISAHEKGDLAASQAKIARQDSLTGLANRMAFGEELEACINENDDGGALAVLWFDLDHFKEINDTYGHIPGDALLAEIGRRLNLQFGSTDSFAARVGGDEFVILTRHDNKAGVDAVGHQILGLVAQPFIFGESTFAVTASVGVAMATQVGSTSDELLARADLALYRAKANGGNRVCFYQAATDELLQRRRILEKELRSGLDRREFELVYQPIIDLVTNEIIACEALLRWTNRSLGSVPPADFVPVAEQINLMEAIGGWVLHEACREASQWPHHIRVAVNVSAVQLRGDRLFAVVRSALDASGLAAERLELEMTETLLLEDDEHTLDALRSINEIGVRITLDDFGTGFSSLSYLTKFPFQTLKIDGSFVRDLDDGSASMAIIQTVVELAATLGLDTVAEHVETQGQLDQISRARCSAGQGNLFYRPLAAKDLRMKLADVQQAATTLPKAFWI